MDHDDGLAAESLEPVYDYDDGDDNDDDYNGGGGSVVAVEPVVGAGAAAVSGEEINRLGRRLGPCVCCKCTNTPLWRKGRNSKLLCNACGVRWLKYGLACSQCEYVPRKREAESSICPMCGSDFAKTLVSEVPKRLVEGEHLPAAVGGRRLGAGSGGRREEVSRKRSVSASSQGAKPRAKRNATANRKYGQEDTSQYDEGGMMHHGHGGGQQGRLPIGMTPEALYYQHALIRQSIEQNAYLMQFMNGQGHEGGAAAAAAAAASQQSAEQQQMMQMQMQMQALQQQQQMQMYGMPPWMSPNTSRHGSGATTPHDGRHGAQMHQMQMQAMQQQQGQAQLAAMLRQGQIPSAAAISGDGGLQPMASAGVGTGALTPGGKNWGALQAMVGVEYALSRESSPIPAGKSSRTHSPVTEGVEGEDAPGQAGSDVPVAEAGTVAVPPPESTSVTVVPIPTTDASAPAVFAAVEAAVKEQLAAAAAKSGEAVASAAAATSTSVAIAAVPTTLPTAPTIVVDNAAVVKIKPDTITVPSTPTTTTTTTTSE